MRFGRLFHGALRLLKAELSPLKFEVREDELVSEPRKGDVADAAAEDKFERRCLRLTWTERIATQRSTRTALEAGNSRFG